MNKGPNRYIRKIAKTVGETDPHRALELFVAPYREGAVDLEAVATRLGVSEVVTEAMPCDGGVYQILDGQHRLVIKVNSLSSIARQRFTLAHEIGHLLLCKALGKEKGCTNDERVEDACDAIAAELLMPAREVMPFVQRLGRSSPSKLRVMADRFGVSLQSAALRVHEDLHLWRRPIGKWRLEKGLEEEWFVGTRPWKWSRHTPNFGAFRDALESREPIQVRDSYLQGSTVRPVYLELLNLGNNQLLGMVAS